MHIIIYTIVALEWLAFFAWLFQYKKNQASKYTLLTGYLGFLAITELLNLCFHNGDTGITNLIVMKINVPLQIVFLLYFLLTEKYKKLFFSFSIIYLFLYCLEETTILPNNSVFKSFSYGIGNLFLIVALLIAVYQFLYSSKVVSFYSYADFWIIIGLIVYYIGSFPYYNFQNYLWAEKSRYNLAYTLYRITQILNCLLYLTFTFASKWKKT
jgi:hypothetical protein